MVLLAFFVIWQFTACSVQTVYISGEKKEEVIEHFKSPRIQFEDVQFDELKTNRPIYIQGLNNYNSNFTKKLLEYFGDKLKIYYGVYKNHKYLNNSGLYLPTEAPLQGRNFAGNCLSSYVNIFLTDDYIEIEHSIWTGEKYETPLYIEGNVFLNVFNEENGNFTSLNTDIKFQFRVEWNSAIKASQLKISKSNSELFKSCFLRQY